jgi:hypothetical protein
MQSLVLGATSVVNRVQTRILAPWEEAVGTLHRLSFDQGVLLAGIGPLTLCLPPEIEEELRPHVGKKVAILRIDDHVRPYRIRLASGDGRRLK